MPQLSAGILLFRKTDKNSFEVLLGHPGGPFWTKKDEFSWSIPKGEFPEGEDGLTHAIREFEEETGHLLSGHFIPLKPLKQKSGKIVYAWAHEGDLDVTNIKSNEFELEWPPKSGRRQKFPEIDRAGWFSFEEASKKILPKQAGFLIQLSQLLKGISPSSG